MKPSPTYNIVPLYNTTLPQLWKRITARDGTSSWVWSSFPPVFRRMLYRFTYDSDLFESPGTRERISKGPFIYEVDVEPQGVYVEGVGMIKMVLTIIHKHGWQWIWERLFLYPNRLTLDTKMKFFYRIRTFLMKTFSIIVTYNIWSVKRRV